MSHAKVDFSNTEIAFHLKSDAALDRAYFLFKMIANEPLVRIGTAATNFALNTHLPVEGIIRATVFDHFCGGVNAEDCIPKIDQLFESGVYSVLDYSVEGKQEEEQFDLILEQMCALVDFAHQKEAMPFAVFKPTAVGRFEIYKKISASIPLDEKELIEWSRIKERFHLICQRGQEKNISILVDAEESWMQNAADDLLLELMRQYNTDEVVVYNTIQAYRWDRLAYLKKLNHKAKKEGFKLGFKLVRGAYMEKERERAKRLNYTSPICVTKSATDDQFNNCLKYILKNLDNAAVFLGTHNEYSTHLALKLMHELRIDIDDPRIWFGQLFGMSDHISYNLAKANYNIAKYLPYGPVRDVMPYLIRRAEENTSVAGQTNRELSLIKQEKKRRKS
ncbi:proline dehydrogenase family protein [Flavobacteriaceae bacterium]|nr:proline dehydrogenase family protein [Flavobacteriaceae bacterium]